MYLKPTNLQDDPSNSVRVIGLQKSKNRKKSKIAKSKKSEKSGFRARDNFFLSQPGSTARDKIFFYRRPGSPGRDKIIFLSRPGTAIIKFLQPGVEFKSGVDPTCCQ